MREILARFLVALPVYAALDLLWLGVLMNRFYRNEAGALMRQAPNWWAAAAVYALFALGLVLFVLPKAGGSTQAAAAWGALFGLVVYGVYDFTNLALVDGWSWRLTAVDALWGAAAGAAVAALTTRLSAWIG